MRRRDSGNPRHFLDFFETLQKGLPGVNAGSLVATEVGDMI